MGQHLVGGENNFRLLKWSAGEKILSPGPIYTVFWFNLFSVMQQPQVKQPTNGWILNTRQLDTNQLYLMIRLKSESPRSLIVF